MEPEVFVPPRYDRMFKAVFGNPHRSGPLRSFLESVLDIPHEDLTEVTLADPHLPALHAQDKQSVVDVRLCTVSGREINVEVQLLPQPGFRKRLAYYASNMLASQLSAGRQYEELTQAITIAITGFVVFPNNDAFRYHFRLWEPSRHLELTDALQVDILELPKLPLCDDGTLLWRWLRFMAVTTREELHMVAQLDPTIAEAADEVERFNRSRDMYLAYLSLERAENDRFNIETEARKRDEAARKRDEELRERDEAARKRDEELRERDEELRERDEEARERDEELRERDEEARRREEEVRRRDEERRVRDEELRLREQDLQAREESVRVREEASRAGGMSEGLQQVRREVAKAMLEAGMPAIRVSGLTKIPLEDIDQLQGTDD